MSRICDLSGTRRLKMNSIAIERSKVTKRTRCFSNVNLHFKKFDTEHLGHIRLRISNRTMRTIEKYSGLEEYLLSIKRGNLTEIGLLLRDQLLKKGLNFVKKDKIINKNVKKQS